MKTETYNDDEFENEGEFLRYQRAKNRVKEIKGFYIHLLVYLAVNLFVVVAHYVKNESQDFHFGSLPVLWGIVILIHAGSVFLPSFMMGKDWEEKKIRNLMRQYESEKFDE